MPTCAFAELEIRSVQRIQTYTIDDRIYNRIPASDSCLVCGVRSGQLHIPGCENEPCPACHDKAAWCDCVYSNPGDNDDSD